MYQNPPLHPLVRDCGRVYDCLHKLLRSLLPSQHETVAVCMIEKANMVLEGRLRSGEAAELAVEGEELAIRVEAVQ